MTRFRSALRFALPMTLLLVTTALPTPTLAADWIIWYSDTDNGRSYSIFRDKNDPTAFMIIYNDDGVHHLIWVEDQSPDDTGKGTEKPDIGELIKKGLASYKVRVTPENSPLSQWIDRGGGGFVPHWNPGDGDGGKGPGNPVKNNTGGLTDKQKALLQKLVVALNRADDLMGKSMGGGDEGGTESAPTPGKSSGRGKGSGGSGDGSGNNDNKVKYSPGGEAATLGPRPDLVNPAPKNKIGLSNTKSNLLGVGLLEGGGGSAGNGPAGAGSPISSSRGGVSLR